MIKIKKKRGVALLGTLLLFVTSFAFAACGEAETAQLSAPENVRMENRTLTWGAVENADYYEIVVTGGQTYETTSCEYSLSDWRWNETYEITVFAKTEDGEYLTSEGTKSKFTLAAPVEEGYDGNGFLYKWSYDLYGYEVSQGRATATKEWVIPDYFRGFPVKRVSEFGFSKEEFFVPTAATWWDEKGCNTMTTSIRLPQYLESIGENAFSYIVNLEEVVIPDSVTKIEKYAFRACKRLKKVTFSKQLKEIGNGAFDTTALESLDLPDGLERIKGGAFGCGVWHGEYHLSSALSKVVIPASVNYVASDVFKGRENLTEVVFEDLGNLEYITMASMPEWWYENNGEVIDGVYYIGNILMETREDFQAKEFTVPSHIKAIISFDGRGVIEKLYIPDGVQIECIFNKGCENLKEIRLPADLTNMRADFLSNTPNLESVVIPEGVESIGYAFRKESGLKELTIFTKIALGNMKNPYKTGYYCPDLTTIIYQGVAYTYSAEQPTEEGNYWYVDDEHFFEIW